MAGPEVPPGDWLDAVRFDERGLVTAIAQEVLTQRILMVAWMDRQALEETARTGQAAYWSRSRRRLWRKGEESGNVQKVREIRTDCDSDVVLLKVEQVGGVACHTGRHSCFFNLLQDGQWVVTDPVLSDPATLYGKGGISLPPGGKPRSDKGALAPGEFSLQRLADIIESRRAADPDQSYVARLLSRGEDAILKKIGEEATETVMAAKDGDSPRIVAETADLWFHSLVMLAHYGLRPEDVIEELGRREGLSGLQEKASRSDGK